MSRPRISRSRLAKAIHPVAPQRRLLPGALLAALLSAGVAHAEPVKLDIPAQSLASALREFGKQAGLEVLYSPDVVKGVKSRGVSGSLEPEEALDTLLQGSGISYHREGNTITLSAVTSDLLQMGAVTIEGRGLGATTDGTGSYTTGLVSSITKLPLTPRETPQTVTVMSRQQMDDFALNSIDDVMKHTPGVTVQKLDSERSAYWARGSQITNFQYDGIPSYLDTAYADGKTLSDMAIYDRIEVIKGATGLLTGSGQPGAALNLIRKRPTRSFAGHVSLGAGSWDNYRGELDVGGPLTDEGNIRGRFVTAYQDKNSYMDRYEQKNSTYYGILEADLTPSTLFSIGMDYQDTTPTASNWAGVPLFYSDGSKTDFPRSFNPGANWSSWEQYNRTVFATLEHTLENNWTLKLHLNHQESGYHAPLGSAGGGYPDPVTGEGAILFHGKYTGDTRRDSVDMYASGPFELFGREHEAVFGYNASRSVTKGNGYWDYPTPYDPSIPNIFTWNGKFPEPDWGSKANLKNYSQLNQSGYYGTVRLKPTDDLALIAGARVADYHDSAEQISDSQYGYSVTPQSTRKSGVVVPYLGAVYDLNDNYSVYASYTGIFQPQQLRDIDDKPLEPEEGKSYELGVKGEFYDGLLNASFAVFESQQDNLAVETSDVTPSGGIAYESVDGTKTRGFEAEVSGELLPGWQLQAGYTHAVSRDKDGHRIRTLNPDQLFRLYTTYQLPGELNQFTVGGGASYQSKIWTNVSDQNYETVKYTQGSYWLVDLMTRYQVTDNLSATLNLNNVFDKKYFSNLGFYNTGYYGEPRNLMLTTRWDF